MPRITDADRARNEEAIRAAIDRLLRGELPPGGKCGLKTLTAEAGVTRTGFYPTKNRDGTTRPGPYQHLGEEFERRLKAQRDAGEAPDPRTAQSERLEAENAELRTRITARDESIAKLNAFRIQAVSQLTAQHGEITVRVLPTLQLLDQVWPPARTRILVGPQAFAIGETACIEAGIAQATLPANLAARRFEVWSTRHAGPHPGVEEGRK